MLAVVLTQLLLISRGADKCHSAMLVELVNGILQGFLCDVLIIGADAGRGVADLLG